MSTFSVQLQGSLTITPRTGAAGAACEPVPIDERYTVGTSLRGQFTPPTDSVVLIKPAPGMTQIRTVWFKALAGSMLFTLGAGAVPDDESHVDPAGMVPLSTGYLQTPADHPYTWLAIRRQTGVASTCEIIIAGN